MNTQSQMTVADKTEYPVMDLVKFVMAICVVAIHTHPLEHCSNAVVLSVYNAFVNCAVPFFFLSTGFLLGKKMSLTDDVTRKIEIVARQFRKTVKLYLIWSAIYFPLAVIDYVSTGKSFLRAALLYIRGLLFIGEHYNSWILWYLLSAAYALAFVMFLLRRRAPPSAFFIVACAVYVISCGFDWLVSRDSLPGAANILRAAARYSIANGRILRGGFYIPMGILFFDRPLSRKTAWIFFLSGFAGHCALKGFISALCMGVCAAGFFEIIMNCSQKRSITPPRYKYMRNISISVYFIHLYVWTACYSLLYGEKTYGFFMFAVTLFFSLILSAIYVGVKSRR